MIEYNGVHGDFEWEIVGRTLRVFSKQRRIGLLQVFENVNAINSEQAQWSAQAKIDPNLDLLHALEAGDATKSFAPAGNISSPSPSRPRPAGLAASPANPTDSWADCSTET
ncbi:MAG: hypothetical protein OXH68_05110 [Gammaproteobacteria bacterium]|nr:hypothetical protein [Gammaproteobacteria bacterium]